MLVIRFVGAPFEWLYSLALGVPLVDVAGAVYIIPLCGVLLLRVDRPWRRRVGWVSCAYGALVIVWVMSMIAGVPWSKNAIDTALLVVYAGLPLCLAVFTLSITSGAALLRSVDDPDGIAVRGLSSRQMVYGSFAVAGVALAVFGLLLSVR